MNNQDVRTITGAVRSMNTAPRGEIDGAQLDTGVLLHWPPHLQDQFRNLVAVGDRVQATGRMETGPAGDTHFEVQSVTDLRTNTTATNPDFVGGPPPVNAQAVGIRKFPSSWSSVCGRSKAASISCSTTSSGFVRMARGREQNREPDATGDKS